MLVHAIGSLAQDRFPRPEFEVEYQLPETTTPDPRAGIMEIVDISLLVIALSLASYFALKQRSRRSLLILMLASLVYFGFIRKGCICAVGSLQNVVLAFADPTYVMPLIVIVFFAAPLIFTLFFGRTFCASVCPLGAAQDVLIVKPKQIPAWLAHVLSLLPYIYLGLAVLFAATGASFIICRYDPYVSIFRFSGNFGQIVLTVGFVILSLLLARPYCRFLCPYGVILGWMSSLSRRHVKITPDECIECRLCEESCPFDAIHKPTPDKAPESRKAGTRRLGLLLSVLPLAVLLGGWSISRLDVPLSRVHPRFRLAERIRIEDEGKITTTTLESRTFRSTGTTPEQLYEEALEIRQKMRTGGWFLGGFLGLVIILKLIALSVRRTRTDYEPDRVNCLSCGRCFKYCPIGKANEQKIKEQETHETP